MSYKSSFLICLSIFYLSACSSEAIKQELNSVKNGFSTSINSINDGILSGDCKNKPKASDDANQLINLKSSVDETYFSVDGKKMNDIPTKLLEVCINNSRNHTIVAQPKDCPDSINKVEEFSPPYHSFSDYDFQFMVGELNECHPIIDNEKATTNVIEPYLANKKPKKKSFRKKSK